MFLKLIATINCIYSLFLSHQERLTSFLIPDRTYFSIQHNSKKAPHDIDLKQNFHLKNFVTYFENSNWREI